MIQLNAMDTLDTLDTMNINEIPPEMVFRIFYYCDLTTIRSLFKTDYFKLCYYHELNKIIENDSQKHKEYWINIIKAPIHHIIDESIKNDMFGLQVDSGRWSESRINASRDSIRFDTQLLDNFNNISIERIILDNFENAEQLYHFDVMYDKQRRLLPPFIE